MAMDPPPVEHNGEPPSSAAAAGDAHRSLPTPFLTKTYQLVDDRVIDDVISWNDDGSTFIVWRPAEFALDLLPKYFKHNNFSSFVRQLNTYGFRKIVPDRWEFANESFRRGEKELLCDIHRRKIGPATAPVAAVPPPAPGAPVPVAHYGSPANSGEEQVMSSTSSPTATAAAAAPVHAVSGAVSGASSSGCSSTAELRDENERLRKENMHLSHELSQMKSLCDNILALMSKYASGQPEGGSRAPERPLELMPLKRFSDEAKKLAEEEESARPRLFGVPIGSKRVRGGEEGQMQEAEVKSEPLNDGSPHHRDPRWLKYCPRTNHRVCN